MKIRAFITHKKAEHFQDCQDRFSVNKDTKSVAVSDGMSQSIFQKIWAEILSEAYTKNGDWIPSQECDHMTVKTKLSSMWSNQVKNRLTEMQNEGKNTTRTENSLALGDSAGATIVGVRFAGKKWRGDVLGDSCLIELVGAKIKRFLSSQEGDSFDNHPDYYDSNPKKKGKGVPKAIEGELSNGMSLLLVSDPFSDFLLEQKKNGKESQFVEEILSVTSHDDFENLVSKWRAAYGMHNDDSTLLIIEHDGSDELNIIFEDNIEKLIEGDTVATPKAPADPFHRNSPQPVVEKKTVPEVVDDSKLPNYKGKEIENQHQESPSSKPSSIDGKLNIETKLEYATALEVCEFILKKEGAIFGSQPCTQKFKNLFKKKSIKNLFKKKSIKKQEIITKIVNCILEGPYNIIKKR